MKIRMKYKLISLACLARRHCLRFFPASTTFQLVASATAASSAFVGRSRLYQVMTPTKRAIMMGRPEVQKAAKAQKKSADSADVSLARHRAPRWSCTFIGITPQSPHEAMKQANA
eukprot:scaffold277436_cov32-Tisochrysis_lutea.AAC.2